MAKSKEHCYICGGLGGLDGKPCEGCSRVRNTLDPNQMTPQGRNKFLATMEVAKIPDSYASLDWTKEKFLAGMVKQNRVISPKLKRFGDNLEEIHNRIASGLPLAESCIIIGPPKSAKTIFGFSLMRQAARMGFKIGPMLDTIEAKRVLVLAANKVGYKLNNSLTYDDYITSDILLIKISHTYLKADSPQVILEILDRRSRLGFGTIFISDYPLAEFVKWKGGKELMIHLQGDATNPLKSPVLLRLPEEQEEEVTA